jgi:CheY-like chemotaxis protein
MSDVIMGEVDGFALCRRLREEPSLASVPVTLLSAHYGGQTDGELAALRTSLAHGSPAPAAVRDALYTDHAVLRNGLLDSGVSFIQKPFAPEALARKLRDVLDGCRRRGNLWPMDELATYIRARYTLIYLLSFEEQRVLEDVHRLAARERKKVVVWSFARGAHGAGIKAGTGQRNPLAILEAAHAMPEATLLVLLDLHPFLADAGIVRQL